MSDQLLDALTAGEWRSGAELAIQLGITRAAVWKRILRLREAGYEIEALAGRGYRLRAAPDRLLPYEVLRHIEDCGVRFDVVHRDEVDSTNSLAAALARAGATEGTAVVAETQTAGRGRLGRTWSSPPNRNLYLSLVLRPPCPRRRFRRSPWSRRSASSGRSRSSRPRSPRSSGRTTSSSADGRSPAS